MNWWPRLKEPPKSSVIAPPPTTDGALQEAPSVDVDMTMRASPVTESRCAQATCTRRTLAESSDAAMVGRALVRNRVGVVPWSKGVMVATSTVFLLGKVLPKSVDFATRIASGWLDVAKRRQVT